MEQTQNLEGLNDAQREAVTHFEGPMLVLAGPGSGKTRVITERVRYLIQEKNVAPENILVITFTKAAAQEMKQRYVTLSSGKAGGVRFGTFHAIFFMILKQAYHYSAENIVRDEVRFEIFKRIVADTEIEIHDEREFIGNLESEISRVKGGQSDINEYSSALCSAEAFRDICKRYQKEMERRRLLDFDDMLTYCYKLFCDRPDICKIWQDQFPFILIDEFQDISQIQYDVVFKLANPRCNLFVVGDDDQSIYGFRGAKPAMMKRFLADYKGAKQCILNVNYRCQSFIVETAGRVIAHNKDRLPKEIRAAKKENTGQDAVEVLLFAGEKEQNEAIRDQIVRYQKKGIPLSEMAILFRTNTQARSMSEKLLESNIPFTLKESLPNLYDHWMVQDIFTYVKVAKGDYARGNILRIINRPKRYVSRNALSDEIIDLDRLAKFYEDKDWMQERLAQFFYDLNSLKKMRPYAAVNFIRKGIGYDDYVREYAKEHNAKAEDLFEILDELQEQARVQDTFDMWDTHIEAYREELKEQEKKKNERNGEREDAVSLMTMHGSKGLEFTCVFIPDANEGITPHNKSVLTADLEEERRMFYVAMTRAKSHLHISYVRERFHKEMDVSRFVEELGVGGESPERKDVL